MASPFDDPETVAFARELLGLLLVVAGVIAVVWMLFEVDTRAGVIALGTASIGAGVYLGTRR